MPSNTRRTEPWLAYWLLCALIWLLQFSPMIGLVGYNITGSDEWSLIGVGRDIITILITAIVFFQSLLKIRQIRISWAAATAVAMIAGVLLISMTSSADLPTIALNIRRILIIPLLFVTVSICDISEHQINRLFHLIFNTTLAVALFGIFEYISPNSFWTSFLKIIDYFSENPFDPYGSIPFEESGRFFTWDLQSLIGMPIRRTVSTYLEPTTLAAALMCGLCLVPALIPRSGRRYLPNALIMTCGLLTFSKAFILFSSLWFFYQLTRRPSPKHIVPLTLMGCAIAMASLRLDASEGMFSHLLGLARALDHVVRDAILGEGMGNAGNYAIEGADLEIGGESGLGNILAQIGVASAAYVWWIRQSVRDILQKSRRTKALHGRSMAFMIFGWYISFLFSASSLGVGGNALIFIAGALYLNRNFGLVSSAKSFQYRNAQAPHRLSNAS